ncbi:hypothetical protein J2S40_002222 [Nocardioides luteus]|uniref:FG-GAP repeat domain-containing protein n=1 Tax=Nocardioides luteus TaxID=1844 RepID=UPI0016663A03|nr:VCBS repeat-containing protein [Nocardioides luteus]MDR7311164.1 hypothetical protein [Nocardioides luteus]
MCDFDADGKLDTAQVGSEGYVVFYQTGKKSAPIPLGTSDPAWQVSQTFCGDFDGDGRVDLALSAANPEKPSTIRAYVLSQSESGTWKDPQQWVEMKVDENGRSGEFLAGDWDGDDKTDLLLATSIHPEKETPDAEGASRVLTGVPALSTGKSFETGAVLELTDVMLNEGDRGNTLADQDGMQAASVDVDGDGSDELVKIGLDGWHDTYSFSEGDWEISQSSKTEFKDKGLLTRAASDVNGDHYGDVVALDRDGMVVVYLGGEDGLADGVEWPQLSENETLESECAYGASSPVSSIC